jgi:hypothetical protein
VSFLTFSSQRYPISVDSVKQHLIIEHNEDDALLLRYIGAAVRWVEDYTKGMALVQQSYEASFDKFWLRLSLLPLPLLVVDSISYIDVAGIERTLSDYRVNFKKGEIYPAVNQCFPCALAVDDAVHVKFQSGCLIPFTADNASNTIQVSNIAFDNGSKIQLSSNAALGSGVEENKIYYVVNSTGSSFQISLTLGGSPIDFTISSNGDHFIGSLSQSIIQALHLLVGHWYNNREDSIIGVMNTRIQTGVESLLSTYRVITV